MRSRSEFPNWARGQSGLTLFEVLASATILSILAAIGFPSMSSALNAHRLTAGLRGSVGCIRVARSSAINRNLQGRILVSPDGSTLTPQVNLSGTWTTVKTPLVLEGVTVSVTPSGGLVFSAQGTLANPVTVTLQNSLGNTHQINVSLLGSAEIA
jgi:prepilin-type N-terminal cleavage/methylation domain-containing protein